MLKGTNILIISIILSVVVLILFMSTPTGIYERPDQRITQIYFADNISSAHQKLIDRFNQEYQGKIEVVPVNLPFTKFSTNERKELLARTLRSKSNRIDVFAVDLIWVPRFARWCLPLDTYFSQEDREPIISQALESCLYKNQLFATPFYFDIGMMYYRRDIIQTLADAIEIETKLKQSITWEEFIKLNKKFSHLSNPFYIYPADNYEGLICSFIEGLASQNQSLFSGDSIKLNTPGAKKTLQLLVDLIHKYKMTPPIVTKYDEFQCYLHALNKDGLFLRGWPGFLRHYRTIIDDTSKFQYLEKAALPHFKGGKPAFVFGGWNLMISKYSTKIEAAMKFITYVLRKENQEIMFQQGGYLPVIRSVYEDSLFLQKEPDLLFYHRLLADGIHRPYLVDYTKISDILSYYIHSAIKKELSVTEALERAAYSINSDQVLIK